MDIKMKAMMETADKVREGGKPVIVFSISYNKKNVGGLITNGRIPELEKRGSGYRRMTPEEEKEVLDHCPENFFEKNLTVIYCKD